ncbi:MAG: hypothetical protein EP344_14505 [Bacteroidetes bacterium]|nr:MAG: hypothetical protein EP344_14505 [Bacteroidota bacterium]
MMYRSGLFVLAFACVCCHLPAQQPEDIIFYISPAGKPGNPGTVDRPFATLGQAREAVRELRNRQDYRPVQILLREGIYAFHTTFDLAAADSGSVTAPIQYAGYPGEHIVFHGGAFLEPQAFRPVTDPAIRQRLLSEVRNNVLELDLREHGITDFGSLQPYGFGRVPEPAPLELFINGARQPLARFPNTGIVQIGQVYDAGSIPREGDFSGRGAVFGYEYDRPQRWLQASDIWLHGHFSFGFNDDHLRIARIDTAAQTITLAQPHLYGVKSSIYVDTTQWIDMAGLSLRGYYVYNLPEEIDQPGEWFLDRQSGKIYLYPPDGFTTARVEVSLLQDPFIRVRNTAHLLFKNIHFTTARGMGVYLEDAHHITFDSCSFSQLGTVAISAGQPLQYNRQTYRTDGSPDLNDWRSRAFHHIGIRHCRISHTGTGGIILAGGDRQTLDSAAHVIRDCYFSHTDEVNQSYAPAVKLDGVGHTVSHCVFQDQRHMAIRLYGNNHRIEYNLFERICTAADDMGAIYTGRDPAARGTVILHNHFKDILPTDDDSQVAAVFLDDGTGGIEVGHNYFERVGSQGDKELFGAVSIHGGHDNNVHHNVFQDCEVAIGNNYWKPERWQQFLESPLIREQLYGEVDITSPVYQETYPELKTLGTDRDLRLNRIAENILINSQMVLNGRCAFFYNHLEEAKNLDKALEKIGFELELVGPDR